jgi:hypothetical protein
MILSVDFSSLAAFIASSSVALTTVERTAPSRLTDHPSLLGTMWTLLLLVDATLRSFSERSSLSDLLAIAKNTVHILNFSCRLDRLLQECVSIVTDGYATCAAQANELCCLTC